METWTRGAYGFSLNHQLMSANKPEFRVAHSPLGFGSYREDKDTGLVDINGRSFIPQVGAFVVPEQYSTADLQRCSLGLWQSCNPYSYRANNPLSSF